MFNFFKRKQEVRDVPPEENVDLESINASFAILQHTACEVGQIASDISSRLTDTEFRFYSIIDCIDDFVCVKDASGKWKTLNKFGQQLYGFNKYEYINKTDAEIGNLYPLHREGLLKCTESDEQAWLAGIPTRSEEAFVIGNKIQYFDVIKTPVYDDSNNRKELIIVGRNITEVKEKTKRQKALFNALNESSDSIVVCDAHGYIIFANSKFVHKFGYDYHDLLGRKMNVVSSGLTSADTYRNMWDTIRSNKVWEGAITNKTAKGLNITCNLRILPVMNGQPEPIYYIGTLKSI